MKNLISLFISVVVTSITYGQTDDCPSAIVITPNLTTCTYQAGSSAGATQTLATCSGGGVADDDVWYQFVANSTNMTITVDPTVGYDAVIQLFSGTCGALISIACQDINGANGDEVLIASGLTIGFTYYLRVYHYGVGAGTSTFNICVTGLAPATNDTPCAAYPLPTVTPSCNFQVYTNSGATDSGEGLPAACGGSAPFDGGYLGGDVWFSVVVPASGELDIHTLGIDYADGAMGLYSGACGALALIECDDDGDIGDGILMPHIYYTGLVPGTTMYIRFWEYDNNAFGQFGICVSSPTNDSCVTAQEICDLNGYGGITSSAYDIDVTASMCGIGDWMFPNPGCVFGTGYTGGSPVQIDNNSWLRFTASATTANLFVQVNSCQNGNGMQMQIFESPDCINFIPVSNFLETATSQAVTATGLTIGNSYYIVVDGFAGDICSYTITATNGVQVVEAIATPASICFGNSGTVEAVVTGTGTYTYSWSSNPAGVYPNDSLLIINPTVNTEYTVDITGVCGSATTATALVIVNDLPTVSAGSGFVLDCNTPSANLDGSGSSSGGYTYNWITPDGNITAGGTSTTPTVNAPGTYTIYVTNTTTGCVDSADVLITDNFAVPAANAGATIALDCNTPSGNLSGSGTGTFSWVASGGGNITAGAGIATPTVNAGGTYTLTTTLPNGCTATDAVVVSGDFTVPTANAGGVVNIDCNSPTGNLTGTGGGTYSWVASGGGNITAGAGTATPIVDAGGTYTLTVTSANGCADTDITTVSADFVNPTASAGGVLNIDCNTPTGSLSGSGGGGYSWVASGGGTINSGGSTANPVVSSAGTYTVTVTAANGCTDTDVTTVNEDFALPNAGAGAATTIDCNTPTSNLAGTGGGTYSWVASGGGNITSGAGTATPTIDAGGTYTITVTSANGCSDTDVTTVNEDFTLPTAGAGAATTIDCNTPTTVLTGTGGGSYSWVASGGGNITSGAGTASPNVDAGGTYTLTVTSPNGCMDTDAVAINGDFTLPSAGAGSSMVIDCNNTTVNLTGSGGGSYSWAASAGGTISAGGTTSTPTVTSAGTFTLTVTAANGCVDTDVTTVSLDMATPVAAVAAPELITCTAPSIVLDATGSAGTGGLTFSWVATTGGNIVSGGATDTPTVNAAGDYTVTVTHANGCTDSFLISVIADSNVPSANAGLAADLNCSLFSVVLDGSGSTSTGGLTYSWVASGGGNIVSGGSTDSPTVDAAGTYTLTVTDGVSGCTSVDVIVVNEDIILPTASIIAPITVDCNNPAIILDGSGSSQGVNFSYNWTTAGGNILSGSTSDSAVVDGAGDYTITVSNATNNCTNTFLVTVAIDTVSPSSDAGLDQTLTCAAADVSLDGSGSSGTGITYLWSGPGITAGGSTNSATANIPGAYLLTITGSNGCTDTSTVQVIPDVNLPVADAGISMVIDCNNPTINLDGSGSEAGATITYTWTTVSGNIISGGTSTSPLVDGAGTYTITVDNTSNGCSAVANVTVTMDTITPVLTTIGLNTIDCNNLQVSLVGTATSGPIANYLWTTATGNIVSGAGTDTAVVDAAGTYTLTAIGTNGCASNSSSTNVTANPNPTAYFTASPDSGSVPLIVSFTDSSTNANSYFWDFGDGDSDTIMNPTHTYINSGNYVATLTITDTNGCTDVYSITIIVAGDIVIEVPNVFTPNGDGSNDHFHPITTNISALEGVIFNRWGQQMFEWWTVDGGWDGRSTAGNLAPEGTYYYILKLTDYQEVVHEFTGFFVLQR
jgi:gliding motility-associated-like protein